MNIKIRASLIVQCVFMLLILSNHAVAQEVLPPVENVRVENGSIAWDPLAGQPENGRVVYNIYRVFPGAGLPTGRNAQYVATVISRTEFVPALAADYVVIASTNRTTFSVIDEATIVSFTQSVNGALGLSTTSRYEIRTNRCTDLISGQSCVVACNTGDIPTGGACRTDEAVVVHQRARFNGYECVAKTEVAFLEADVFCLR